MADYTRLSFEGISNLITPYQLGDLHDAVPMEGGQANSSYKLTSGSGRFILSVCDEKESSGIDNLTRMLEYLGKKDFPTSRIVKTQSGDRFMMLDEKPVYIKKYIEGEVVRSLNRSKLKDLGRVLADLHTFSPLDNMPDEFPYGMTYIENLITSGIRHDYIDWLSERILFLRQAIDPEMERGVIHGDIFWDNLLFSGDRLAAVIDFEEACFYFTLFDLGMTAVGCCTENGSFDIEKIAALLKGYQRLNPLNSHEKKQLKIFVEYAAVAASSWRFHQYNVKYPGHRLARSYRELTSMAGQIHEMDDDRFMRVF